MDFFLPDELIEIRTAVRELCAQFPGEYWRALEPDRYPEETAHKIGRAHV